MRHRAGKHRPTTNRTIASRKLKRAAPKASVCCEVAIGSACRMDGKRDRNRGF